MLVAKLSSRRSHAPGGRHQSPSRPTIRHDSPTLVLVPTTVGCCPSAAERRPETACLFPRSLLEAGLRILILSS
jgi:hypothetical protein